MADLFPYCVDFVLSNETEISYGKVISIYEDKKTGECSNWGISLAFLRSIKPMAAADDIKALTKEDATHLYAVYFWGLAHLDKITLPTIAARVFDAEVNMGHSHGVACLQQTMGVEADGVLGPLTAAACNASNEGVLYGAFVRAALTRYQMIHDHQVKGYGQATADRNLSEWRDRLAKHPPLI